VAQERSNFAPARGPSSELDLPSGMLATQIKNARALRSQFFDRELFGEPAWDILLDLYESELGQFRRKVSSVCSDAGVPATTALRWLNLMEGKGLIQRSPDPRDKRRIFISLSPVALAAMNSLFDALWAQTEDR
jgi:DNA-binding MarR family transcriptional regulator